MSQPPLTLLQRLSLACRSFIAILTRDEVAARAQSLQDGAAPPTASSPAPAAAPAPAPGPAAAFHAPSNESALQLLGLLQREARFVDFTEEDVAGYADADIGAAARLVHEGCRKVLREHFTLASVRSEAEGSRITLAEGFDPTAVRLTGNVVGKPPYSGQLNHRGWRVTDTRLPRISGGHDVSVVAQAEVEL